MKAPKSPKIPPSHLLDRLVTGERAKISKKKMVNDTRRRYLNLPEIKAIEAKKKKEEEAKKRKMNLQKFLKVRIYLIILENGQWKENQEKYFSS